MSLPSVQLSKAKPKNSAKIDSWEGPNKTRVRHHKLHEVQCTKEAVGNLLVEEGVIESIEDFHPSCLTFAGSVAKFERLLINHNVTTPKDILTIQTYKKLGEGHCGKEILKKLIRTRSKHLGGMKIWPYSFLSFSQKYSALGDSPTCEYPSNSQNALWSKPPYSGMMNTTVKNPPARFSVLDLDLCGIFNQTNADSITNLFKSKALDDRGVMFITHLKGRDVRGGKLFEILLEEFETSEYVNFDSIKDAFEEDPTYYSRYVLVPLYYMSKAYDSGYILQLNKLIEYRDKNPESGLAVNMLQYFFNWVSIKKSRVDPSGTRVKSMCAVLNEDYGYHCWID